MTIAQISLDTHWQDARQSDLPPLLAPWLLEPASLTARLKRHCRQFRVQLLNERSAKLPDFLHAVLPVTTAAAQVREVILWCDDLPCVYAQSWLPQQTINVLRPLADLGERPLGDYIFQQPGLKRGTIEVAQLDITLAQLAGPLRCYARRSVFMLAGQPLLVAEAFLPALAQLDNTARQSKLP